MTTAFDNKMIPEILALVAQYGKTVTITLDGTSLYDPETGYGTQGYPTEYDVKVTPPEQYERQFFEGETVKIGDARVWLPASGLEFTPVISMKVDFDNQTWTVQSVLPIYTGEQIALYGLQIRRAG